MKFSLGTARLPGDATECSFSVSPVKLQPSAGHAESVEHACIIVLVALVNHCHVLFQRDTVQTLALLGSNTIKLKVRILFLSFRGLSGPLCPMAKLRIDSSSHFGGTTGSPKLTLNMPDLGLMTVWRCGGLQNACHMAMISTQDRMLNMVGGYAPPCELDAKASHMHLAQALLARQLPHP